MTLDQSHALRLFGLTIETLSRESLSKAFRPLALQLHPDQGGSDDDMRALLSARGVLEAWLDERGDAPLEDTEGDLWYEISPDLLDDPAGFQRAVRAAWQDFKRRTDWQPTPRQPTRQINGEALRLAQQDTAPISILVPCWNYAEFLPDCLISIAAQTVRPRYVLVVDDASTDDTEDVAKRCVTDLYDKGHKAAMAWGFARHDSRMGLVALMNKWVPRLPTEWVCAVSADDWIEPTFIEAHAKVIEEHRADPKFAIAYCGLRYVVTSPNAARRDLDGQTFGLRPWDAAALRDVNFVSGAAVYRKSAAIEAGMFPDVPHEEDHKLWIAMAERGFYGVGISAIHFNYRQHHAGHRNYLDDQRRR